MNVFQNTIDVDFLIWETNPMKRKANDIVEMYSGVELKPGDIMVGQYSESGVSVWKVKKVIQERDCRMPKKKHVTVKVDWSTKATSFFSKLDCSRMSTHFQKLVLMLRPKPQQYGKSHLYH